MDEYLRFAGQSNIDVQSFYIQDIFEIILASMQAALIIIFVSR